MLISKRRRTTKQKYVGGLVLGLGGGQEVVYLFYRPSFGGEEAKHINKISRKSLDNPGKMLLMCLVVLWLLSSSIILS